MRNLLKNINYKIVSIVLLAVILAGAISALVFLRPAYRQKFVVTGDVRQSVEVRSFDGFKTYTVVRDGRNYECLKLSDLVEAAGPYAKDGTVVMKGDDALLAEVDAGSLAGMYIAYTAENAWECINENHPPTSNIKRLSEIWVVSKGGADETAVNFITTEKNIASFTPGQFYMQSARIAPVFEGESARDTEKGKFSVTAYTERRYAEVSDILPGAKEILVMGGEGQYAFDYKPGRVELKGNALDYVFSDGKKRMKNVRGILADPPAASNMDAYQEAVNFLTKGERVLVVLMDGFGYNQYEYAKNKGYVPFLGTKEEKQATTVFEPVTPVGLSAILTGKPPYMNGIYKRGLTELKAEDIFAYAAKAGKKAAYIEGNVNIVQTSLAPELNADRNGDESTDSEVFESAAGAVQSGADYVFVHFHGIDDMGHASGDINETVMQKVKEVDGYIAKLLADFTGRVIVTADHGMHRAGPEGGHGAFRFEDMLVPYISFNAD
jgi:hypothetical protein